VTCIICDGSTLSRDCPVAPFYALRTGVTTATMETCESCGFTFYLPRITDEQAASLYDGYRDERYCRERAALEPGYTPDLNAALSLPRVYDFDAASILDYGGGDGRHIPPGADRYVYDLSGEAPVPGVRRWGGEHVALVMCCHVMEHVADPRALMAHLLTLGDAVYIEVPHEGAGGLLHEHINIFTPAALGILTGAPVTVTPFTFTATASPIPS